MGQQGRNADRAGRGGRNPRPRFFRLGQAATRRALPVHRRTHAGTRPSRPRGHICARADVLRRSHGAGQGKLRAGRSADCRRHHARALYARHWRGTQAGRRLLQRARQLQGTVVLVETATGAGPARYLHAVRGPAGHGRNAAPAEHAGDPVCRTLGIESGRLADPAVRCRSRPDRHDRDLAGRPFRAACRRIRAAIYVRRGLGRQPQLGRSAAETPAPRR